MKKVHQCESMKSVEAWIANNQHEWVLHINHVATEQDLEENHYLEEIGQTIDNVTINVLFCPYCGEKVDERQTNITPSFKHNDFSKW